MTNILDDKDYQSLVEFLKPLYEKGPSFGKFLSPTDESPDYDTPIHSYEMRDDFLGNMVYRTLHGGVIASMLDGVGGHAVWLNAVKELKGQPLEKQIKRISRIGSIDLRVDYLRPGKGKTFKATAAILRMGGKVAVARMELHNEEQDLIATGTGTYTTG